MTLKLEYEYTSLREMTELLNGSNSNIVLVADYVLDHVSKSSIDRLQANGIFMELRKSPNGDSYLEVVYKNEESAEEVVLDTLPAYSRLEIVASFIEALSFRSEMLKQSMQIREAARLAGIHHFKLILSNDSMEREILNESEGISTASVEVILNSNTNKISISLKLSDDEIALTEDTHTLNFKNFLETTRSILKRN